MKMIGQLVQSKAALFDANGLDELYIYDSYENPIMLTHKLLDDRIYGYDPNYRERVYFKQAGWFTLSYSINSELEWSNSKDNVKVRGFLNGVPLPDTLSYGYTRNSTLGDTTNSFTGLIKVEQPNSYLDLRISRHNDYRGVIVLQPPECKINLKRERPLEQ